MFLLELSTDWKKWDQARRKTEIDRTINATDNLLEIHRTSPFLQRLRIASINFG